MLRFLLATMMLLVGWLQPSPTPTEPISLDNADRIEQIQQIGYGTVQQLEWDDSQLAVTTTAGVVFYDEASLNTGEALSYLSETRGKVFNFRHFEGQSVLAAIRADESVFLYHPETNQSIELPDTLENGWIQTSVFSPDGRFFAMKQSETWYRISIWDTQTGTLVHRLSDDAGYGLVFSPYGTLLASVNDDRLVQLWDVTTWEVVASFTAPNGIAYQNPSSLTDQTLAFSPDGAYLAVSGLSATLWNLQTGQEPFAVQEYIGEAFAFAFSPDGTLIAAASAENTITLFSATSGEEITTFQANNEYIYGLTELSFSPDSRWLAVAGMGSTVRIWDIAATTEIRTLHGFAPSINTVAFSPDSETIAFGAEYNDLLQVWGVQSLTLQWTLPTAGYGLDGLAFTPDGELLLTLSSRSGFEYWQLQDGTGPFPIDTCCSDLQISFMTGNLLVFGDVSWDISTLGEAVFANRRNRINDVAFSSDRALLAAVTGAPQGGDVVEHADDSVHLWDVETAQEIAVFPQHEPIWSVAFSPDGSLIATGSLTSITLWDVATGTIIGTMQGHTDDVRHLTFSADGALLISGGWDHTIRLWDVANQVQVKVLEGHVDRITDLTLSPDGTMLASASHDGTVRLWGVR